MFSVTRLHLSILIVGCVCNTLAFVLPRAIADCPSNGFALGRQCIPFVENKDIAGISFNLYTWTDPNVPGSPAVDSQYLEPLQNAAAKALPVYADFMQTKIKTVRVYLTEDFGERGATDFLERDPSICSVRIAAGDIKSIQKTLAHELYHCVQRTFDMVKPVSSNTWWYEGSAEFFGNLFYPNTMAGHMSAYCAGWQLYSQGYAGSLFFQHLSNTFTPSNAIHDWVVLRIASSSYTGEGEQQKLSVDHFITQAFPSFATQFTDKMILFSDNEKILGVSGAESVSPKCKRPVPKAEQYTLPKGPGVYRTTTSVVPWRLWEQKDIVIPSKRLITFTFKTPDAQDSQTVLRYRKSTDSTWITANKGVNTLDSGCSSYSFLATSTLDAPQNEFPVTIEFTVKEAPKKRMTKRQDENEDPVPTEPMEDDAQGGITVVSLDDDQEPDDDEGDSCSSNQCIVGNWNLDLPSMQTFLSQQLATSGASITNLAITGSSTFSVTEELSSSMTFENLGISYDGSASGFSFHTAIDITGSVAGTVKLGTEGTFTWTHPKSDGSVKTTTTVADFGDPIEVDFTIDEQYGPATQVKYTCNENVLQMSGYIDGKFTWAYTLTREIVV